MVNTGHEAATIEVPLAAGGTKRVWGEGDARMEGAAWRVELPPRSAGVWMVD